MVQTGFDFGSVSARTNARGPARIARGMAAQAAGVTAEARVAKRYIDAGCELLAQRWRGLSGEIDLILRDNSTVIFVEVKKSATIDMAAERLGRRQMDRICGAALEYCDTLPTGSLTEMRFDAALVDDAGHIAILENAFGQH